MKYLRLGLAVIVCVALIAGLAYGALWLLDRLLVWVMAQSSQIAGAIIAFAGSVIAGIGAVVISQQRTKAREIAEAHRPKKTEIYSDFITKTVGILRDHKNGQELDETAKKKLETFFFDFTTRVVLWGSPGVLQHYVAFRRIGQKRDRDPNVLLYVDDILQAMRKDLGLSNWGLARGDLIKMFLTDPETLDAMVRNTGRGK